MDLEPHSDPHIPPNRASPEQTSGVWQLLSRRRILLPVTAVLFTLIGSAVGIDHTSGYAPQSAPPVVITVTPRASPPQADPDDGTVPGDGDFTVGIDLQPGVYRTAGPVSGRVAGCTWERSSTMEWTQSVRGFGRLQGPGNVVIRADDAIFITVGCQTWRRVG